MMMIGGGGGDHDDWVKTLRDLRQENMKIIL